MLEFNCQRCGARVSVREEHAGRRCRCPHCKELIQIPGLTHDGRAPAPPSGAPPQAAPPLIPRLVPRRGPAEAADTLPFPAVLIDRFLDRRRHLLGMSFFQAGEQAGYWVAVYGMLVMALLAVIGALVRPTNSFRSIPDAKSFILAAFLLVISQYIVAKVRAASQTAIDSTPSRISSTNITDCIAVLLLGAAAAAIPAAIFEAAEQTDALVIITLLVVTILGALVLLLSASLALAPQALNVAVEGGLSAGAEGMGLLSFLLRFALRVAPLVLGGWVVFQGVGLLHVIRAVSEAENSVPLLLFIESSAWPLISLSLIYLGVHVVSLLYHLMIDGYAALFNIRDNTKHLTGTQSETQAESPRA